MRSLLQLFLDNGDALSYRQYSLLNSVSVGKNRVKLMQTLAENIILVIHQCIKAVVRKDATIVRQQATIHR